MTAPIFHISPVDEKKKAENFINSLKVNLLRGLQS